MISLALRIGIGMALLAMWRDTSAQTKDDTSLRPSLVQATLTGPGSTPFYLQAVITERGDPNEHVDIEMFWVALDKWRRTIKSQEFSQTLIVNGVSVFEQDSDDYFPLGIRVLSTAIVDPNPVLDALRPGDRVRTKANGQSNESGKMCLGPGERMCVVSQYGLTESLGGSGRAVDFMDYQDFGSKRVARHVVWHMDPGDSLQAQVTELRELKNPDEGQFEISNPSPDEKQIRSEVLPEADLRGLPQEPALIIWPQVLDGSITGETSYYVSVDRSGQVREVFPLAVAIERADDSARKQIMRWKFRPFLKDGIPVQTERVLRLGFDTRAYGPAAPLTDAEVRKLATGIVDPEFPPQSKPGATCNIRIAVDADGKVIEQIAGEGDHELTVPCMHAIGKWHFSPILENGQPRPYRAEVTCRVPEH
jgi:hypothetical protein